MKQLLSAFGHRNMIINPYRYGAGSGDPLLSNLTAWWSMDETGANTRADSHGSNDLDGLTGSVTNRTGKVGANAVDFGGSTAAIDMADTADVSTGDVDFCHACWVYFDAAGSNQVVFAQNDTPTSNTANYAYLLYRLSGGAMQYIVGNTSVYQTVDSISVNTLSWNFVVTWHDATANTINIQLNNATPVSAALTTGSFDCANNFVVGALLDGTYLVGMDGAVDELALWNGYIPDSDERTWLYNSGSGRSYSDLQAK